MLFLLFRLGSDRYAIDASQIVEILPLISIKKVLRSPPGIAGTINYRGAFVPVIDLTELTLSHPAPSRLSTRIILVRCCEDDGTLRLLGLIAENATEIAQCEPNDFVPSGITNELAPYLGPIAMGPHGLMQRIEVNKLLTASVSCALSEHAA
jgi:chemotaxis-related protein WspB